MAFGLGSGVSASAGLPAWENLLRRICGAFFFHWEYLAKRSKVTLEQPPHELSIAFAWEYMWSKDAINVANSFAKGDPLLIAQQIKNCIRDIDWKWLLRRSLYDDADENRHDGHASPLIEVLAKMCDSKALTINSVINYNYDDLFELCLKRNRIKFKPIFSEPKLVEKDALPIYHPHGFLPLMGGKKDTAFVLAEDDYHENIAAPHSWANLVQLQVFSSSSVIFIGTSLKDPALRRLLRLARTTHHIPHFAFLPKTKPFNQQNVMFDALFDRDVFKLGIRVIRYNPISKGSETHFPLLSLINLLLESLIDENKLWQEPK